MDKYMNFTHKTLKWYLKNKRNLPWRYEKPSAYHIWLSEIIMQQTRIAQGTSYYQKFIEAYPSIEDLANAEEDEVLKNWQGLGYYSRARNLHKTAQIIVQEHSGIFPEHYDDLVKLKGIGEYTASAIASIVFGVPKAVVDGNVFRVLTRYFGILDPIDGSKGKMKCQKLAESLLDRNRPGDYNQAVMEFGALQCVPRKPNCSFCPLQNECYAFKESKIDLLPIKSKKTKQRDRYFNYFLIEQGSSIYLKKRDENDIWKNLYDFPLFESNESLALDKSFQEIEKLGIEKDEMNGIKVSRSAPHLLSHQKILAQFIRFSVPKEKNINISKAFPVSRKDLKKYALPKLLENYILNESDLLHLL